MVTFSEDGFTIEVKTGINPTDAWLDTHDEMIDMLQSEDKEMHENRFRYLELIRSMMPNKQTAKKMISK